MAQVVREADALDEIEVGAERCRNTAPNLRHFQRMSEARAVIIALVVDEDLRFIFQPPKCCRVQDAVTIFLKDRSIGVLVLWKLATSRVGALDSIRREHLLFLCLALLTRNDHSDCSSHLASLPAVITICVPMYSSPIFRAIHLEKAEDMDRC